MTAARKPPKRRAAESLAPLLVLDRLEVGAPRVEPTRISASYRVVRGKERDETTLSYRYEEAVFDPGRAEDRNLASLILAQVALNYGLFAREIVFEGELDRTDRRFLEEMARNTAREIYVKKFLEPNPFLRGTAAALEPERLRSYLQADLVFASEPRGERATATGTGWPRRAGGHAVLSSGGKDSLLSFGLLRELGREPAAVFVNESGRHWYTALNAHRYLAATWPATSRVWTDSDRLFSWMLRHLPFVRPDFARLRSDEYPVRLWTVAVFLFGALPVLRKRGVGRLVIGDEYDTTVRRSHRGITHYDGLYDQSRYFDNALSRFFGRKGWPLSQFSLLRPLSEMLIQGMLAKRYPTLQAHQVSCHATHIEGERVLPCGRCEKCRRIVGMLVALDADPGSCGYSREQIDTCLRALALEGVHQESEAVEHLAHLLAGKGVLPQAAAGSVRARPRPEIAKLRMDAERSPAEGIPFDLREPLYRIFLEHAEGAVERRGRVWVPLDLMSDPALLRPYVFEKAEMAAGRAPGPAGRPEEEPEPAPAPRETGPREHVLGELTWPAARERLRETDLALLPVGSIEQHGPHLPLDTDAWDARHLALRVAEACSRPRPLVLPLIAYGVAYHHEDFAGTLGVGPDTLSRLVYEVGMSAARNGVTKLVIINGHGGNIPALRYAAQMINRDAHIFTCVDTGDTSDADVAELTETANDVHAGEIETSTALASRPGLVDMSRAKRFVPRFSNQYLDFSSRRSVEWYARTAKISPSGVLGDPTKASAEKGERIWEIMIEHLVAFVDALKGMSLDEIYERRY